MYPFPVSASAQLLRQPRAARRKSRAFTLVETALALGIVAFALLPLLGLLPLGLQISHSASDLTASAQIAQRLAGMVQQADYSSYSGLAGVYYYFDVEGQPLNSTGGAVPAAAIYTANIFLAAAADPAAPAGSGSLVNQDNVATLRIRIVNDPAHILQGTPTSSLDASLVSHAITIPVYLANNGA